MKVLITGGAGFLGLKLAHETALEAGRVINFPGLCGTAQQMVDALQTRFSLAFAQRVGWAFDQPTPKEKS